ncbi:IS21 family transposase [Paraburkholderia sp. MM5482-R1]|uniref:IS21 family transposase n=1 Tax=unclassified Paraburkholderia TaxID=2615204 RepID=UPI003D1DADA7
MTIGVELEAQILRYYHVEKWRCGTIARQLHVHRGTVQRVLAQAGLPRVGGMLRPSQIDAYLPFIHDTLKRFPSLTASRLYAMVTERGYRGNLHHFRHLIAIHRPRPTPEAYLRLRTLPGEQGQVDWAHFDHLQIGRARRPLMAFVMVLSWSRQIYLRFFLDARMDSFLAGHAGAFAAWSGLPRILLYDNLRSAVLERQGDAIRFNPTLLAFAAHHRFEPRPVAVARGNEYGVVKNMCCSVTNWAKAASLRKANSTYYSAKGCAGRPSGRAGRAIAFVLPHRRLLRMPPAPAPLFPD